MSSNAYDKTSGLLHQIAGIPKSVLNTLIAKTDAALNNQVSSIEPTTTATSAHLVGEYIIYGLSRKFAKVTSAIAIGDTIANGTNVDDITQGEVLTQLNSSLNGVSIYENANANIAPASSWVDLPVNSSELEKYSRVIVSVAIGTTSTGGLQVGSLVLTEFDLQTIKSNAAYCFINGVLSGSTWYAVQFAFRMNSSTSKASIACMVSGYSGWAIKKIKITGIG